MARKEYCVLTNMCMVYDEDKILVQDKLNPEWPGMLSLVSLLRSPLSER